MKKYCKQDFLNILIIVGSFFAMFVFLLLLKGSSYASKIDYSYQHYMIPEYFRMLFYKTKNFFPSYAINLGMGQNIYNFSYYGLLSPIVLISFILPFIKMKTYLEIATIMMYLLSVVLCYSWISDKSRNTKLRFACTFLYAMSGPLVFHTHRHIMFMNYMPFVFLGLKGVEKYVNNKRPYLLIISNFLLIMTSYFFSVPALLSLVVYAVFLYLKNNKKVKITDFIKTHLVMSWYFILPVLISCVLLLPSLKAIIDNRFKAVTNDSFFKYLIPHVSLKSILYDNYSMGLCAIFLLSIMYFILKKDKSKRFLAILFALIICFPCFNYILNGFMYLNNKVFIPFIPLAILLIMFFLEDLFLEKQKITIPFIILTIFIGFLGCINYKLRVCFFIDLFIMVTSFLLFKKKKNINIILAGLIIVSLANCIRINVLDDFSDTKVYLNQYNKEIEKLINNNINDGYRTVDLTNQAFNVNNIRNINEYKTTMYSSVTNKYYKDFYWNVFDTENPKRNDAIFGDNNNPLFNIYFANKYLISSSPLKEYQLIDRKEDVFLYENTDAFSLGYVNYRLMSESDFDKLETPYNLEAVMNYTIIADKVNSNNVSKLQELNLNDTFDYQLDQNYQFKLKNSKTIEFKTKRDFTNKLLIINFKMNRSELCRNNDTYITINNIENLLTCSSWKYHNRNYSFTYVIYEPRNIKVKIEKGRYDISDIKVYELDYDNIKSINKYHDNLVINNINGDVIDGSIYARNNGYLSLSIPYDKGYNIYVDGNKVDYEKVNKSFIGFKVSQGNHKVLIKYEAPWLKEGKALSITGLCLLAITIGYKRKKHK